MLFLETIPVQRSFHINWNLPLGGLGLIGYIFMAIALYAIAKRRGISGGAAGWFPVARLWLLGKVHDDYQAKVYGRKRNMRTALLVLGILQAVLWLLLVASLIAVLPYLLGFVRRAMSAGGFDPERFANEMDRYLNSAAGEQFAYGLLGRMGLMLILLIPMLGVTIACAVVRLVTLYRVFQSCDPGKATLFTVLSIFFSGLDGVFLFVVRDKDQGMYPQRGPGYYPPVGQPNGYRAPYGQQPPYYGGPQDYRPPQGAYGPQNPGPVQQPYGYRPQPQPPQPPQPQPPQGPQEGSNS